MSTENTNGSDWISIADRLPDTGLDVLFLWTARAGYSGEVCMGHRLVIDGEQIWYSTDLCDGPSEHPLPPTHWQALPTDFVNTST